jgi:hypothetical protein
VICRFFRANEGGRDARARMASGLAGPACRQPGSAVVNLVSAGFSSRRRFRFRANCPRMRTIRAGPNLDCRGHKSQDESNEFIARVHVFVNASTIAVFADSLYIGLGAPSAGCESARGPRRRVCPRAGWERAGWEEWRREAVQSLLTEPSEGREYAARMSACAAANIRTHFLAYILDGGTISADSAGGPITVRPPRDRLRNLS